MFQTDFISGPKIILLDVLHGDLHLSLSLLTQPKTGIICECAAINVTILNQKAH